MSVESVLGDILTELQAQKAAAAEEREERKKSRGSGTSSDRKASDVSTSQLQKEIDLLNERASIEKDLTKRDIKRLDHLTALKVAQDRLNQAIEDGSNIEQLKIHRENVEKSAGALDKLDEAFKKAAGGAALFESMADSFLGLSGPMQAVSQAIHGGIGGMGDWVGALRDGFVSGELFIGMSLKMLDMLVNFALETDAVLAAFRASTGAGNEFNSTIADVERSTFAAGVTFEDVAASVGVLKNALTDYTYLSKTQRDDITKTTVLLQKMGFEFSTQAEVMQIATQSMNMSTSDSKGLLLDLASVARSLGRDIDVVGQDFVQNAEFLIRFGDDGVEVFEELAVSAKALGTEIGLLVKVMEGFDTFDAAGSSVGRLNAILGGPYLNAMDMLNASYEDPAEGIRMLRDGFDQAGRSIEDFSGAELKAVSSAMGLSLKETKEILGATNEEMEIRVLKEEALAEQAAKTQSITEALSSAWKALYVNMEPLITNVFVPMVGWLSEMAQKLGEFTSSTEGMITFGTIMGGVFGAGIALMMAFTTAIPIFGLALAGITWPLVLGALAFGGIGGSILGGMAGTKAASAMEGSRASSDITPRFHDGEDSGPITTEQAIVEQGEIGIFGGQGTDVFTKKQFFEGVAEAAAGAAEKAVATTQAQSPSGQPTMLHATIYIGQTKLDDLIVKALESPAAAAAFGPFSNVSSTPR